MSVANAPPRDDSAPLSPPITDWTLRLFEAVPVPPPVLAIAVAALFTGLSQIARIAIDADPYKIDYAWLDGLNGVIFVFTPTCLFYLRRGVLRDLSDLRPALGCTREGLEEIAARVTVVPTRRMVPFVVGAILFFVFMPVFDPNFFAGRRPEFGEPELTFFMLRNSLTGWVVGHAIATEIHATRVYAELGRRALQIDLLDTSPLHPFTRRGLRSALFWISAASLVSLFWLSPGAGLTNGPIMLAIIVMVVFSFFYSISGVRRSLLAEKRSELERLRSEIRRERGVLLQPVEAEPGRGARLAGLLAYHELVERAPEWPFDTPVVLRLSAFVVIGLGSWLGGALVERLLEAVL